ncbi:MAG TPA: hypothetical protein GX513_03375 [Firmicutes bacterium]|nr:hypothetical protein [Bacillota bacterium]
MREVTRKIYAHALAFLVPTDNNVMATKWDGRLFRDVMAYVKGTASTSIEEKEAEWFFFLDTLQEDDTSGMIFGWFKGARIGYRPHLIKRLTLAERPNPKEVDEGERTKVHFVVRLSDGLLLLEDSRRGLVTAGRFISYIRERAKEVLNESGVRDLSSHPLIEREFIEELKKMGHIRVAGIRVFARRLREEEGSEALNALRKKAAPTDAEEFDLVLRPGRRRSLSGGGVITLFESLLKDREFIVSGWVKGETEGRRKEIRLDGTCETYLINAPTDEVGQVLSEPLLSDMVAVAKGREGLYG